MRKCGECGSEEELLCLAFKPFSSTSSKKVVIPPPPSHLDLYILYLQYSSKQLLIIILWSSISPTHMFTTLLQNLSPLPLSSFFYLVNYNPPPHLKILSHHPLLPVPSPPPPYLSVSRLLDASIEFPVILFKCHVHIHFNLHVCILNMNMNMIRNINRTFIFLFQWSLHNKTEKYYLIHNFFNS